MKEQLSKLLKDIGIEFPDGVADYLVANGVTIPVRCKDCEHYHQYHQGKTNELCEWGKCKLINMDVDMPENGFCCYGERRNHDGQSD